MFEKRENLQPVALASDDAPKNAAAVKEATGKPLYLDLGHFNRRTQACARGAGTVM